MYVSEAEFIVRAPSQTSTMGFGGILQGVGLTQSTDQSYAVNDYILSRDAVRDLERHLNLRRVLDPPGADFLSRFPRPWQGSSSEALFNAYRRFVSVSHDSTTGVSTLKVKTFRASDAQKMAAALMIGGEALINRLNERADQDAVTEAMDEVQDAESKDVATEEALTQFRDKEGLVDPAKTSAADLELTTKLEAEIQTLQAERSALASSAPNSPQLPMLDSRIRAYQREEVQQNAAMAGQTNSLAPKISIYEQLTLKKDFADKLLASSLASVERARDDARRKRLYLEQVVNPGYPDSPTLPHRFQVLGVVIVTCLLAYGITILIIAGLKEHRQH
ncbi:MAG: chain-length determining protein [Caulobacteraceae bacterium]